MLWLWQVWAVTKKLVFTDLLHFRLKLILVLHFFFLKFQDISAHESNILGSFCDMNVRNTLYPYCTEPNVFIGFSFFFFKLVTSCFLLINWILPQGGNDQTYKLFWQLLSSKWLNCTWFSHAVLFLRQFCLCHLFHPETLWLELHSHLLLPNLTAVVHPGH